MHPFLKSILLTSVLIALAACKPSAPPAPSAASASGRPAAFADAKLVKGRVICPLESVNGNPVRDSRSFTIGSQATLVGWSTVADAKQPTPAMMAIVFRSVVPDGSKDLVWPGMRVARPDFSQDPRLLNIGYSASGSLPAKPGKYRVLVWVGDQSLLRECDTAEVFDIHE